MRSVIAVPSSFTKFFRYCYRQHCGYLRIVVVIVIILGVPVATIVANAAAIVVISAAGWSPYLEADFLCVRVRSGGRNGKVCQGPVGHPKTANEVFRIASSASMFPSLSLWDDSS